MQLFLRCSILSTVLTVLAVLALGVPPARGQAVILGLLKAGPVGMAQSLLVGLPVAALDWAGPLVAQQVKEIVEAAVPGFTASYRLRAAEHSILDLTTVPKDSRVIRNIGVRFRSESIPLLLLDQHAPPVASMADPLRGLPVVFVDAQRAAMPHLLNEALPPYPPPVEHTVTS